MGKTERHPKKRSVPNGSLFCWHATTSSFLSLSSLPPPQADLAPSSIAGRQKTRSHGATLLTPSDPARSERELASQVSLWALFLLLRGGGAGEEGFTELEASFNFPSLFFLLTPPSSSIFISQLKMMGLYAHNTIGDGNCLFRSVQALSFAEQGEGNVGGGGHTLRPRFRPLQKRIFFREEARAGDEGSI